MKDGIKRLQELNISKEFKEWYNEECMLEEKLDNYHFWHQKKSNSIKNGIIPLSKVVGTSHWNYGGKKWIEVLGCLGKYKNKNWDKSTFYEKYKDGGIRFSKYGDSYFINGGNNRTTIAKFFGLDCIEAPINEYFFDYEFFNVLQGYKNEKLLLELNGSNLYRGATWILKISNISFYINGIEMLKKFLLFYKKTQPSWYVLKKMVLLRKFGLNLERNSIHLFSDESFKNEIFKNLPGLKYEKLNV